MLLSRLGSIMAIAASPEIISIIPRDYFYNTTGTAILFQLRISAYTWNFSLPKAV
jgi:hypothetical protein